MKMQLSVLLVDRKLELDIIANGRIVCVTKVIAFLDFLVNGRFAVLFVELRPGSRYNFYHGRQ